jgi:hypothetical protein
MVAKFRGFTHARENTQVVDGASALAVIDKIMKPGAGKLEIDATFPKYVREHQTELREFIL